MLKTERICMICIMIWKEWKGKEKNACQMSASQMLINVCMLICGFVEKIKNKNKKLRMHVTMFKCMNGVGWIEKRKKYILDELFPKCVMP